MNPWRGFIEYGLSAQASADDEDKVIWEENMDNRKEIDIEILKF